MKKTVSLIALILSLCILCTGCIFKKSAKGKNAKIQYTGTASVSFYPVCPECNHVSPLRSVNISDGEYDEGSYMCEECYEVYIIQIDRR